MRTGGTLAAAADGAPRAPHVWAHGNYSYVALGGRYLAGRGIASSPARAIRLRSPWPRGYWTRGEVAAGPA